MKKAIGGTFLLNIIIFFILLVFAFLIGMISYNKAFKVNTRIADFIEKNEGYNQLAKSEIDRFLSTIGYEKDISRNCPATNGAVLVSGSGGKSSGYCVYEHKVIERGLDGKNYISYYYYTVTTFLYLDLPVVNRVAAPITSESEHIYNFDHTPIS
jgi:hypothetical protein